MAFLASWRLRPFSSYRIRSYGLCHTLPLPGTRRFGLKPIPNGRSGVNDEALSEVPGVRVLRRDDRLTQRAVFQYCWAIDVTAFGGANNTRVCAALRAEGIPVGPGYPVMYEYPLFQPAQRNHPVAKLFPDRFDWSKQDAPITRRISQEVVWLDHSAFIGDRKGVDDIVEALRKVQQYAGETQ